MIALPKVFTIPPGSAFARVMAQQLWSEYENNLLGLSDVQIYLPNRRSCRAVADAFLEISDGKAAILPQLTPLGDIDEDDLFDTDPFILDADPYLTPGIHALERQLLLAGLVAAKPNVNNKAESFALAGELARLLDRAHTESVDLKNVRTLVTGDLAAHWEQTCEFLSIITEAWPQYLAANNLSDPAQRRNLTIEKKIEALRANPPQHRVIAAGSTGSIPAVAKLLDIIARLPKGEVILSGFDPAIDRKIWDAIDETHPYFYQKQLLTLMDLDPAAVKPWPLPVAPHYLQAQRLKLATFALQPEEIYNLSHADIQTEAPQFIAAENPLHEALVIALRLREILNEKGATALVVTPDRLLAQRLRDEMARWDVAVNDSAGESLDQKPVGRFLLLLSGFSQNTAPMTAITAILSHTLNTRRDGLSDLNRHMRNRLLPPGGLDAWRDANALLNETLDALNPLQNKKEQSLHQWSEALIKAAEYFCPAEKLWHGDDGENAANLLRDLINQPQSASFTLDAYEFDQILRLVFQQQTIRPRYGTHPRLRILSPIEARLQHADYIILGGLNETVWPAQPSPDPWLSRPMLTELGFGSPERRIGQSALDFFNLFCHPNLTITWSKNREGAPVSPSRWVQQIQTVLEKNDIKSLPEANALYHYALQWDDPSNIAPRDKPEGNSTHKPETIRVTDVGGWKRDPYGYYAKRILQLNKTDPLDRDIEARDWGSAAHDILDNFFESGSITQASWKKSCDDAIGKYALDPSLLQDWRNRLRLIGDDILKNIPANSETEKKIERDFANGNITVKLLGRADRIDTTPNGLHIVDYKTGSTPSETKVRSGDEPQLGLLAHLAQQARNQNVSGMSYIRLTGKTGNPTETKEIKNPAEAIAAATETLSTLLNHHYGDGKSYPATALGGREHDDMRQLKRTQEWAAFEGSEDTESEDAA